MGQPVEVYQDVTISIWKQRFIFLFIISFIRED